MSDEEGEVQGEEAKPLPPSIEHQPQDGSKSLGIVGRRQLLIQEVQAQTAIAGGEREEEEREHLTHLLNLQKGRNQKFFEYLVELRNLEIKYEEIYKPFYAERASLLQDKPGFWLQVLKSNAFTAQYIQPSDEEILGFLVDIRSIDDPTCDDYSLEFTFSDNPFFSMSVLTKRFKNDEDQILDEAEGCEIDWKKGKNVTVESKKQKIRGKMETISNVRESFFHFFKTSTTALDDAELSKGKGFEHTLGHKEIDEELGVEFRDEVIPNALLYYLGIRKRVLKEDMKEESGEEGEDEETPQEEAKSPPPKPRK